MLNVFLRVCGEKRLYSRGKAKEVNKSDDLHNKTQQKDQDRIVIHDSFSECCFPAYKMMNYDFRGYYTQIHTQFTSSR